MNYRITKVKSYLFKNTTEQAGISKHTEIRSIE